MNDSTFMEFVGLPGCGKSTLARELRAQLRAAGHRVGDANPGMASQSSAGGALSRVGIAGLFALTHPILARRGAAMVWSSRQEDLGDVRAVITNWLCKCRAMVHARHRPACVSDEGVLHAVWSIAYRARTREGIASSAAELIAPLLPQHWIVIHVDAGEISTRRLIQRAGRPNRLARDLQAGMDASVMASAGMTVMWDALESVRAAGTHISVITVRNRGDDDVAGAARRIGAELARLRDPGSAATPLRAPVSGDTLP